MLILKIQTFLYESSSYSITEAHLSGFVTLIPKLYLVKEREVVSYPASAPNEIVGEPRVAVRSTRGFCFKAAVAVTVA